MRGWYAAGDVQDLSSVMPNGTSATPRWATVPEIWTRTVPAKARAPVSGKPAMPPVRMVGTAAKVCGPWIKVGAP